MVLEWIMFSNHISCLMMYMLSIELVTPCSAFWDFDVAAFCLFTEVVVSCLRLMEVRLIAMK